LTVAQALQLLGTGEAREARLLLAAATGISEASLIAFPGRALSAEAEGRFREYVAKRLRGEPVAYILGHKEFHGLELEVDAAVLIPRPETELLVDLALEREFSSLLDLGTGSGAIALAVKKQRPHARVVAVDVSAEALQVARANAVRHGLDIELRQGRWFEPLAGQRFDVIVSNPPYVAAGDRHLGALQYEPHTALVGGDDGLDPIREIARGAVAHLNPGGWLLVEHGMGQQAAVAALFAGAGLESLTSWPDLARIPRIAGGKVK
jgi:release factor glutamine methyltransferase